ncbi:MAG: InlB B-repeat-containing protein, partial [Acholeplasmataceae bacterium]
VFAGWYDNVDLDGEVMDVIPKGLSGDLTLYAKWVDPEVVEGVVIVDENLAGLYYGQKIIIDDAVYQVGVNLFTNLVDAVDALVEGDVVVVLPGTYVGDFTLEVDNVTLIGPNHDVNPNTDNREEEAIIDGVITLGKEVANVSIKGFKFVDESQVLNVLGPVGTTEVVATNVDGFEFVYNIVESKLEDGNGFIYFVEAVSSYSRDLVISYNYFTVIAEDSALEYFVYLDNHAGLEVVGNVFENIPKTAFYVNDTTKGLAGETKVLENMFLNIGEDAFKVNWLSPLPGTTMGVLVADNLFDDVGGVAVYFGSMNNNDSLEALHILRNEFRNINAGVHLDRVHATANVLVNFNKFVDVPTTFYIKDAKTAGTPVTLDATKNAYLEDGAVITPDANKFVGSPDYSDPLVGVVGFNAYGQYEVSFNEYETNSDKLRAEFIKDWNAKFETTWTTLKATDFHASASTGAGGSATKDISNSNLYKFFHDEVYEEKWGWLLDYMATQGGIHPQRQLVALMGNGTSPDAANPETLFQLWDLMHLTFSFANFFNQATDNMGYAPIDFNVPSKYATLATFNDQILKNYELYAMINEGGTVVLPEPPKRVNYNFVGYKVGEDVYNAGDNVVVDEGMVFALVYQVVEYDVTFFDGEVELVEEATTYTHEAKKDLPTIEKEGYLFLGWYTNVELEGDPVTSIPAGATGDKVFYAGWEGLSYAPVEVTFELNGGTSAHYVQASRFNEVDWSGTTVIVKTSSQANWYNIALKETNTPNLYEVLGKGSGGYSHDDATLYIQYHDEITGIYKPVMSYVFENLAVGNLVLVKNIPATSGTSPIDIYFLLDDSSSIKEDMLLPEEFSICPLRVGYTFDGWYDNAAFDGEAVESYPGFAEDDNVTKITYYAKWEQDDLSVAFVRNQPVNSKVSVKGVVTAVAGINAFIQDATAGIYIYVGSGTDYVDDLVVGNEVLITGVIDNYNGQIQLKTILKVEVLKTEQGLPDPVVLGELDLDLLGEHQGKLLSMEGLRIKNIPTLGTSHVSIILTRDDVEIIFYIYSYVDGYEALKDIFAGALVGQMVDLVGVPIGFHNNAQLVPTAVDQLVLKAIDGEAIKIYVEEQLDPGEEAIIDLALADKVTVKEVEYTVEWVSNKP